jgi:hypothetical protein
VTTPIIELDAADWKHFADFHKAFCVALGAPNWHGTSINAYLDSILWGDINKIDPPYILQVKNSKNIPHDIREFIEILQQAIMDHRAESKMQRGYDVEAKLEFTS